MRKAVPFAVLAAMALVTADHVIAGNGAGVFNPKSGYSSTGAVKADRLPIGKASRTEPTDQAAVVYKDRYDRELFRTDALANSTIVVRGFSVPVVTVRENADSSVRPLVFDPRTPAGAASGAPSPSSVAPSSKPAATEQKLPRGCEAAASPLSSAASSRLHARCVA